MFRSSRAPGTCSISVAGVASSSICCVEAGIRARGLDINHEMVEVCRARGLEVYEGDALTYLLSLPDESLGGLIAAQVVEHLPPTYLMRVPRDCLPQASPRVADHSGDHQSGMLVRFLRELHSRFDARTRNSSGHTQVPSDGQRISARRVAISRAISGARQAEHRAAAADGTQASARSPRSSTKTPTRSTDCCSATWTTRPSASSERVAVPMPADAPSGLISTPGEAKAGVSPAWMRLGSRLFGASALFLYQSVFWLPGPPLKAKIGFALFGVFALLRPDQALLVVAGLTPLSMVLWPSLHISPIRGAEALALAVVAGWFLRGGRSRQSRPDPLLARLSLLFGLLVVAACIEALTPLALTWSGPQSPTAGLMQLLRDTLSGGRRARIGPRMLAARLRSSARLRHERDDSGRQSLVGTARPDAGGRRARRRGTESVSRRVGADAVRRSRRVARTICRWTGAPESARARRQRRRLLLRAHRRHDARARGDRATKAMALAAGEPRGRHCAVHQRLTSGHRRGSVRHQPWASASWPFAERQ